MLVLVRKPERRVQQYVEQDTLRSAVICLFVLRKPREIEAFHAVAEADTRSPSIAPNPCTDYSDPSKKEVVAARHLELPVYGRHDDRSLRDLALHAYGKRQLSRPSTYTFCNTVASDRVQRRGAADPVRSKSCTFMMMQICKAPGQQPVRQGTAHAWARSRIRRPSFSSAVGNHRPRTSLRNGRPSERSCSLRDGRQSSTNPSHGRLALRRGARPAALAIARAER